MNSADTSKAVFITADKPVALAEGIPGVLGACDISIPQGSSGYQPAGRSPLGRRGLHLHIRPSVTLLDIGS